MAKRLGRGLADIIPVREETKASETAPPVGATIPGAPEHFVVLKIDQIRGNRFQPRSEVNAALTEELKSSIERDGVIEPIVVRPIAHGTYELVAGGRRLQALQALGREEVPAVVRTLTDQQALEFSLVENVQRQDLSALDEARGYQRLLDEFGYTQENIAQAIGKERATIANTLRLLKLPAEIQEGLASGAITMGHARALLGIEQRARQLAIYGRVRRENLSVRELERLACDLAPARRRRRPEQIGGQFAEFEDALRKVLGTKVRIIGRRKGGRIVIEYFSGEDLARILQTVGALGRDG